MTDITYSREYLRGIPEQRRQHQKKQLIQSIVLNTVHPVTTAATNEKTSYIIEEAVYAAQLSEFHRARSMVNVTLAKEDILYALQEKFPGCVVSFQEAWIDTAHNTRVLKKGILIDWS
jgi:hypothetical protein